MPHGRTPSVSQLLVAWGGGEPAALQQLTLRIYHELHKIARADRADHEAYLRLLDPSQPIEWENRAHFFGIAARPLAHHPAGPCPRPSRRQAPDVLEIDEALDRLAEFDERRPKVIELRYFGAMDREEVASALGLTLPTVKRGLLLGEAWLRRSLSGDPPKGRAM